MPKLRTAFAILKLCMAAPRTTESISRALGISSSTVSKYLTQMVALDVLSKEGWYYSDKLYLDRDLAKKTLAEIFALLPATGNDLAKKLGRSPQKTKQIMQHLQKYGLVYYGAGAGGSKWRQALPKEGNDD